MLTRTSPQDAVATAYDRCRRMQCRHDPTFFLATARLPRRTRPAVHALYGFLRGADEIVDGRGRASTPETRRAALDAWQRALQEAVDGRRPDHPVLAALADAGRRHDMPLHLLETYMQSMRVDCADRVRIPDDQALDRYMNGSAATVGRLMAPLLDARGEGTEPLARLGVAFQLTNFIRDVREDWAMDRVYLPGLDEDELRRGVASPLLRGRIADDVARARGLFADTVEVEDHVPVSMRRGMRLARAVYGRVLDRVEALGYDVLAGRTTVGARDLVPIAATAFRGG
ncbi:phytoene/squalene synthase family protein [Patulibacter minatonensis]|uniref:phytoene/squalene synthase family protein n=1 Tax=Patulibacter minatonensis TaxID=298163 RepID=UPI0004798BC3|nr:phytoene/squalene synthase family protein [Patulibacter minatonensis]